MYAIFNSSKEKIEVKPVEPVDPAQKKEPDIKLDDSLRAFYQDPSKATISLLIPQDDTSRQMPIGELYTELAIIGEEERKAKSEEVKSAPQKFDSLDDGRIPTHESIFEPKQPISLKELLKHKKLEEAPEKKIVILGSAGIGKSTLCQHIAYMWAKKELFQEFEYVFWLPLRSLNKDHYSKDSSLANYLERECNIKKEVVQSYLKNQELRKKTLLLLDGHDELSKDAVNENGSLHHILRELKEFPNVIITSRPSTIPHFKSICRLEILGFDSQGIENYIQKFFTDPEKEKAKKLKEQLKHPLFKSLAHIPINLEIFCSLAAADEPLSSTQSPTMTSIYTDLTHWLFTRFIIKQSNTHLVSALEGTDARNDPEVKPLAEILEDIAWEAMHQDKLYIPMTNITKIYRVIDSNINPQSIRGIGPLRIERREGEEREGVFIHLTFQEFFAAAWLARLYAIDPEKAKDHVHRIKFEPRYKLVLYMTAGVLSGEKNAPILQKFFDDLLSEPYDLSEHYELDLIARCFEECQNPTADVKQYSKFVDKVLSYMQLNSNKDQIGALLNRNHKLMRNPKITEMIVKELKDEHGKKFLGIIEQLVRNYQPISQDIFEALCSMWFTKVEPRSHVVQIIGKIAKNGGEFSPQAVMALIDFLRDPELGYSLIDQITTIAKSEGELGSKAEAALIDLAKERSHFEVRALAEIVIKEGDFSSQALEVLEGLAKNPPADQKLTDSLIQSLAEIVKSKCKFRSQAIDTLIDIVKTHKLDEKGQVYALFYLMPTIVESCENTDAQDLESVFDLVKDSSIHPFRGMLVTIIAKLVEDGKDFSGKGATFLIDHVKEILSNDPLQKLNEKPDHKPTPSDNQKLLEEIDMAAQGIAVSVLSTIIKNKKDFSSQTFDLLINLIRNPSLKLHLRQGACHALAEVIKAEGNFSSQAEKTLMDLMKDPSRDAIDRGMAGLALVSTHKCHKYLRAEAITLITNLIKSFPSGHFLHVETVSILSKIGREEEDHNPETLAVLIDLVQDLSINEEDRRSIFSGLKLRGKGEAISKAFSLCVNIIKKDRSLRDTAIAHLRDVAIAEGDFSSQAVTVLKEVLQDPSQDLDIKQSAAYAFKHIANSKGKFSSQAIDILTDLMQDLSEGLIVPKEIASIFEDVAKERGNFAPRVASILIKLLQNPSMDQNIKVRAVSTLEQITKNGADSSFEVAEALMYAMKDPVLAPSISRQIAKDLSIDHFLAYSKENLKNAIDVCNIIGCACFSDKGAIYQTDKRRKIALQDLSYSDAFNLRKASQQVKKWREPL